MLVSATQQLGNYISITSDQVKHLVAESYVVPFFGIEVHGEILL